MQTCRYGSFGAVRGRHATMLASIVMNVLLWQSVAFSRLRGDSAGVHTGDTQAESWAPAPAPPAFATGQVPAAAEVPLPAIPEPVIAAEPAAAVLTPPAVEALAPPMPAMPAQPAGLVPVVAPMAASAAAAVSPAPAYAASPAASPVERSNEALNGVSENVVQDAAVPGTISKPQPTQVDQHDLQHQYVPQAGDLLHKVNSQLSSDHRLLGKVSAALMSVQSSVDKTEQSMLGKVLDMQTARSFFVRHGEIDVANQKMSEDVKELNTQVEDLSSTLSKEQKAFLANALKYRQGEGKLRAATIEDKTLIESIRGELSKENDVQQSLKKLTEIHKNLLAEAQEAKIAGEKSAAMLKETRTTNKVEVKKHKSLRDQLVQMNNYSIACHAKVQKASKKLGRALVKDSKDNKASIMTMKQKKKANTATEQRLLAEHAVIVSEIKRYERNETKTMERMKDLREDLVTLKRTIVTNVRESQTNILEEKERVKSLRISLMENSQAADADLVKKGVADDQLLELNKKLHDEENPILIATLEGQNSALEAELTQAYAMWRAVKEAESAAELNVEQARAEVAAAKDALMMAEKEEQTAQEEGEQKLAEVVKQVSANKAKMQLVIEKAEAAVAGKCKPRWDALWKKKSAKLKKCSARKNELSTALAQKDLLMQTLKAQNE